MERRLYRSRKNRVIAGVAGGLGEYLDIDPVFVRIIFVLATFASGIGLLAYVILWIVVPHESIMFQATTTTAEGEVNMQQQMRGDNSRYRRRNGGVMGGIILIVLGCLFLADNYLPRFNFWDTWPLILVAVGAGLIYNSFRKEERDEHHEDK